MCYSCLEFAFQIRSRQTGQCFGRVFQPQQGQEFAASRSARRGAQEGESERPPVQTEAADAWFNIDGFRHGLLSTAFLRFSGYFPTVRFVEFRQPGSDDLSLRIGQFHLVVRRNNLRRLARRQGAAADDFDALAEPSGQAFGERGLVNRRVELRDQQLTPTGHADGSGKRQRELRVRVEPFGESDGQFPPHGGAGGQTHHVVMREEPQVTGDGEPDCPPR